MVYKPKHEYVYNVISKQMWQVCVPKPRYEYVRSHGFVYVTLVLFTIYSLRLSYFYLNTRFCLQRHIKQVWRLFVLEPKFEYVTLHWLCLHHVTFVHIL